MTLVSEQPEVVLAVFDLADIIDQHQANVWRYLRYLGAATADADDLTQETFLAFNRAKFEQRSPAKTGAYLRTVARNQLLMLRRFQGREIDTVGLESAEKVWAETTDKHGDTGGDKGGMEALLETLADCLKTLDGRTRQAIDLFYRDRQGRTEIAATLAMKPEGVKTLLRRTRDALRKCIERKTTKQ